MTNITNILYGFLVAFRFGGIIVVTMVAMGVLVSEAAKSKLSPAKIVGVTLSGLLAAVAFWMLPTLVNYARSDANIIVPDHPVGGYR